MILVVIAKLVMSPLFDLNSFTRSLNDIIPTFESSINILLSSLLMPSASNSALLSSSLNFKKLKIKKN